jgi:hypothetical protein
MSPDEQEALSIKYGNRGVWLVPLSSGRFGIFDRGFQLVEISGEDAQRVFELALTTRPAGTLEILAREKKTETEMDDLV